MSEESLMPGFGPQNITTPTSYRFSCTLCGDCCRGRQDVALNKDDLMLMARHRGYSSTAQLFREGLVEARYLENGCFRPFIRFRTKPLRMCPFLQNDLSRTGVLRGLCSLHPYDKPLVCHLAPLGRTVDLHDDSEKWQVYEPSPGCPGMGVGPPRSTATDLAPFRERLNAEIDFFRFLEAESPACSTTEDAITRLFSYPVENTLSK